MRRNVLYRESYQVFPPKRYKITFRFLKNCSELDKRKIRFRDGKFGGWEMKVWLADGSR